MSLHRILKYTRRIGLAGLLVGMASTALQADPLEATITSPTGAITVAKNLTQSFTATSTDSVGYDQYIINSFSWTFGDGTTGSGSSTSHAYPTTGTYTVTLKVSYTTVTILVPSTKTVRQTLTATATRTITVVNPPSISSFTASKTSVESGQPVTLSWVTADATSCSISGVGTVTGTSVQVYPAATTTYNLTALGVGPSATATVSVSTYAIAVTISPGSSSIPLGGTQAFVGTVSPANQGVTWSTNGGSLASGSGSSGTYSNTFTGTGSGTFTVTVTSQEDPARMASATVVVQEVSVATPVPAITQTFVGGSVSFSALVSNAVNTGVDWSVNGGGTINAAGVFTASQLGNWTVTATSQANRLKTSTAVVQVTALSVAVTPGSSTVKPGLTQQFSASVTGAGSPGQAVTWSVVTANGGMMTSGGLYTAPTAPGDYVIQAKSAVDGSVGTASVHVPGWKVKWKKDIIYMGTKEVAEIDSAGIHVTQVDHLGTPRFVTNASGAVETTQKYLPFGETLDIIGTQTAAKGYTNHEQTDPSGLIYMQARFYAPQYHRFTSTDPARDQHFEDTQSWNIYSYVRNMPTMQIDPTGMLLSKAQSAMMEDAGIVLDDNGDRHFAEYVIGAPTKKTKAQTNKPKDPEAAKAAYGETNGLTPEKGKDGKVDEKSKEDLTAARAAVAEVSRRNNHVHRKDGSKKKDKASKEAWNDSVKASGMDAKLPAGVRHFFLRQDGEGTQKPDWAGNKTPYKSFGPFRNAGGGDVPKGNETYIDFYQGVK